MAMTREERASMYGQVRAGLHEITKCPTCPTCPLAAQTIIEMVNELDLDERE